jgi:hypothetical protein
MANYLIQTNHFVGYYKNPFKPQGRGLKFSKWVTVDAASDMGHAKAQFLDLYAKRDQTKLEHVRCTYLGKVVINQSGRVYEPKQDADGTKWMGYVETLPGMEDVI